MPRLKPLTDFLTSMARTLPLVKDGPTVGFKGISKRYSLEHEKISGSLLLPHRIRNFFPASPTSEQRDTIINGYNGTLMATATALQNNWKLAQSVASVSYNASNAATATAIISSAIKVSDSGLKFYAHPDGLMVIQKDTAKPNGLADFVRDLSVLQEELEKQPEFIQASSAQTLLICAPRATDKKEPEQSTAVDEAPCITRAMYPL